MRSAIAALLLATVASASVVGWQSGRQFVYDYGTRATTAMPELKNQVSGLGLRSRAVIQVKTPSELLVKMTENGLARIESETFAQDWHKELPLSYSPMESEKARALEIPFKVLLRQGQVVEIEVDQEDPIWSVNIKRGLASQLSLSLAKEMRIAQADREITGNGIQKKYESERAFEVEHEPSVTGTCRTRYSVVPLPDYVAKAEERDLPVEIKEKNQERPAYVITKSKDFGKCGKRAGFIHSGFIDENEYGSNLLDGVYKRFSSRTATTRYLIRGEPTQNFVVERVWTEDNFLVKPFATKTESLLVATNQTLVLRDVQVIRNPINEPQRLVKKSLQFEQVPTTEEQYRQQVQGEQAYRQHHHHRRQQHNQQIDSQIYQQEQEEQFEIIKSEHPNYPQLTKRPQMVAYSGLYNQEVPVQKVMEQIKHLIYEVEQDIKNVDQLAKKQPSAKIEKISRALTTLNLEEMKELYRELVPTAQPTATEKKVVKQVLVDALALCGTNPAIMLLKEKIQKREIKGEQAAQLIMTFPMVVKTPTPEMLKELVHLAKSIKEQESVWTTALLSTSSLIHRACVNSVIQRNNYGQKGYKYCGRQEVQILLPYLKEELYQTQKPAKMLALVQAIGNLGAPEVFDVLVPVVRGQVTAEKQIRSQAIWALARLARTAESEHVLRPIRDLLTPIFNSPVEPTPCRIAAFMTVLATRPAEAFFAEAATGTWFEQSQQVGQFVYTTLETLANSTYPSHRNVSRMAQVALPLAKPFKLGAQYSQNILMTHAIPERNIASMMQYAQMSGKYSLIPEAIYVKSQRYQGGFDMPLLEFAFNAQGIQTLINELIAPTKEQGLNAGLEISTRKDQPTQASLWAKIVGQFERVITFDTLKQWAEEGIVEFESQNQFRVNYQKTLPMDDAEVVFPTANGLPVYFTSKSPMLISVQGKIEIQTAKNQGARFNKLPAEIVVKTDLKPFICYTALVEAGVASPLTKEVFTAGHKSHGLINLPGKVEMKVNLPKKEFEIVALRASNLPSKIELVKLETLPYTGHAKFYNFVEKNIRSIKVQKEMPIREKTFGQKTLGLAFEAIQRIDEPSMDLAGLYHRVQPHNFLSLVQFVTLPHTLKTMTYQLNLNLPASETKEAKLKVVYGKQLRQWNVQSFETEQMMEQNYDNKMSQEQYEKFAEHAERYFANPMSAMPECDNEDSQCREFAKDIIARNPYNRRNQEQQLESETQTETPVHSVHAELSLQGSQPRRLRSSLVMKKSPSGQKQTMSFLFEKVLASQQPFVVRAHAQMNYPALPLNRQQILEAHKTALGHMTVQFGKPSQEKTIKARIVLAQTQEQKEVAAKIPAAKQCQEHENRDLPYTPACMEARLQATLLNKVILDVEAEQELPKSVRNMTYQLDDLVKYVLYPHMSQQRVDVRNPEQKVKIVMDFKPKQAHRPWTVLDAKVFKPKENTFYQMVKLSPVMEAIFPISARYPTAEKALNFFMGQQYTPVCKVQNKLIQTFDNVSIPYPLNECYHLITKDCSKQVPVQVFAKNAGEGKQIKMNIGTIEVEITPAREVIVNGQQIRVQKYQKEMIKDQETQQTVLVVKRPIEQEIVVVAPVHGLKIRSDGKRFSVQMSNIFRGRTCGLCGDMNGEKTAELKDPQGCIRHQVEDFVRSYDVDACASQAKPIVGECEREETRAVHYDETLAFAGEQRQSNGLRYITKVENRGETVCFSVKPVPKCALGHQPTNVITMEMGFHCVNRGRAATELSARAGQTILEEMFEKSVDFNEWISVPEACQAIEAY